MTKEEFIKQEAFTFCDEYFKGDGSREYQSFTAGAEMMSQHMKGILEYVTENDHRLDEYQFGAITVEQFIEKYFSQLNKLP